MPSAIEDLLQHQLHLAGVDAPTREYRFHDTRKWRFDFAWPEHKVAVEVEGGTWIAGRHNRGVGFAGDCDKYNEAILHGWKVLRFTAKHIKDGVAKDIIIKLLEASSVKV